RGPEPVAGTTVVTPSHAEVFQLTRAVAHSETADASRLATTTRRAATLVESWGIGAAAVTMGQAGAVLVRSHGAPMVIPTRSVAAFDPCGAGDAFAAALVTALVRGSVLPEAVERATKAATDFVEEGGAA